MTHLGFATVSGHAIALLVAGAPVPAIAQAPLAPANPQQELCVEAFADTPEERAMKEAIGGPPAEVLEEVDDAEGWEGLEALQRWGESRAIEVLGSEEAARTAGEKIRIEKYTRRIRLLREAADAGHLPSLYRLVRTAGRDEYDGIPGAMGPEEKASALRHLYENNFPLVPQILGGECLDVPEPTRTAAPIPDCAIGWYNGDYAAQGPPDGRPRTSCNPEQLAEWRARRAAHSAAYEAERARFLAETAARREGCLDLIREGGFRGHMYAWERLASYDHTTGASEVGIVPPVEQYAWLELRKLAWRSSKWGDQYNVPLSQQQRLAKEFLSDEELGEAVALAETYTRVLWPRRIDPLESDVCQLLPQFAGDPDPFASDLLPR